MVILPQRDSLAVALSSKNFRGHVAAKYILPLDHPSSAFPIIHGQSWPTKRSPENKAEVGQPGLTSGTILHPILPVFRLDTLFALCVHF